jgi:hypothetical protein
MSAASAKAAVRYHRHMTAFPGKTVMSVNKVTIHDETAADSGTKREHYKILHPFTASIYQFSQGGCICVVGQFDNPDIRKLRFDHFCKMNNADKGKVGSKLDSPFVIITVWCTYANTGNFNIRIIFTDRVDRIVYFICKGSYIKLQQFV